MEAEVGQWLRRQNSPRRAVLADHRAERRLLHRLLLPDTDSPILEVPGILGGSGGPKKPAGDDDQLLARFGVADAE